jgi:hypothetical protein
MFATKMFAFAPRRRPSTAGVELLDQGAHWPISCYASVGCGGEGIIVEILRVAQIWRYRSMRDFRLLMRYIAVQFNSLILPQRDGSFVRVLVLREERRCGGVVSLLSPMRLPLRSQLEKENLF